MYRTTNEMQRPYMIVVVIFLLIVSVLVDVVAESNGCSREVSRKVSKFLTTELVSNLELASLHNLPLKCPLHPKRSLYWHHESNKTELRAQEWQCGLCGKKFVSEFYLDRHMELHHSDVLQNSEAICPADYCSMTNCDRYTSSSSPSAPILEADRRLYTDGNRKQFVTLEKCSDLKMRQLKEQCNTLAEQCFVADIGRHRVFQRDICDYISCQGGVARTGFRPKVEKVDVLFSPFFSMLLRIIIAVAVFVAVMLHMLFAEVTVFETVWRSVFGSSRRARASNLSEDLVGSFRREQSATRRSAGQYGFGWFISTIGNAFRQGFSDFFKALRGKKE